MHEIHRPALIDSLWYRQRFRLLPDDPLSRLDPQVQFQVAIDAIHPLVIPSISLDVAQVQKAQPEPPVPLVVGQADQVVSDCNIFC